MALVGHLFFGVFLHGIALIIHRLWQTIGFNLPKIISWFITFNFVNIAWIFFRAQTWEDAIKIIKGMLGFNGIILHTKLYNCCFFLEQYGISFGNLYTNIDGTSRTTNWILAGFVLALLCKNSNQFSLMWRPSAKYLIFTAILFTISILNMTKITEFLYFNF